MELKKIMDDLVNIKVNLDDEDKTLLLLRSLPFFFSFKDALFIVRRTLSAWMRFNRLLGPKS